MKLAIMTLNKTSIEVARHIKGTYKKHSIDKDTFNISNNSDLDVIDIYTLDKYLEEDLKPIQGKIRDFNEFLFKSYDAIVYVMAMGIVVRDISPYIKHKSTDPAVICVSVDGRFVIPVLSGHLGGANDIACDIASGIQGVPVITTASDVLGKEAVDLIAKRNDLVIDSFKTAMDLTARMINDEKITIVSELKSPIKNARLIKWEDMNDFFEKDDSDAYVYVGYHKSINCSKPLAKLINKKLVVGIGARKNTQALHIMEMLTSILKDNNLDIRGIKSFKSIDIKKDEKGIIEIANALQVPFETYSSDELLSVSIKFEESDFVKSITGVGSVCMPSGYLGSNRGKCLVEKLANNGITISIWEAL